MLNQFAKVWLNVLSAFCCVFLLPVAAHKWNRYKDGATDTDTDTATVADTDTDTLSLWLPLPVPVLLPHMRHIRERSLKRTKATTEQRFLRPSPLPCYSSWSCPLSMVHSPLLCFLFFLLSSLKNFFSTNAQQAAGRGGGRRGSGSLMKLGWDWFACAVFATNKATTAAATTTTPNESEKICLHITQRPSRAAPGCWPALAASSCAR